MSTLLAVTESAPPTRRLFFRPDVEGLRAVAIVLVVLNHVGVPGVRGGYVGVDVFFVISGYLITSQLVRDRVPMHVFWSRRALRLLPASATVVVATLAAAWWCASPLLLEGYVRDALTAAGYVANLRFAAVGTDYLAADAAPSPFQHFWSLAVEEQFYLLWPLVLLARRRWLLVAGLVAASFTMSVTETTRSAPWAYFGTHTRVWELGVGALLALYGQRLAGAPGPAREGLAWAGLAAIGAAAVAYGPDSAYPGALALLPVAGAAAVIAGDGERLLTTRPFRTVGRLSYGWYLWHWPMLVLVPVHGIPARLGLAGLALGLAALTRRLVEDPIRFHPRLRSRARYGALVGVLGTVAVIAAAAFVHAFPRTVPMSGPAAPPQLGPAAIRQAAALTAIPSNLRPPLTGAAKDLPVVYADHCHLTAPEVAVPAGCAYGDLTARTTVVLFGDSHAAQWFPAVRLLATEHHWRLVSLTKSSCSAADALIWVDSLHRPYSECQTWRAAALARIAELAPQLVVTSSDDSYRLAQPGMTWSEAWRRTFTRLGRTGARVVDIADTPAMGAPVPACLAQHPRAIDRCGRPIAAATAGEQRTAVLGLAGGPVTVVDPIPWLCGDVCPPVLGNVLLYRDASHLTTEAATALAPLLAARLGR